MKLINLRELASEISLEAGSLYKDTAKNRALLIEFMVANEWFGMEYIVQGRSAVLTVNDEKILSKRLKLWLSAFKQPGRVKISLMLDYFKDVYPEFCKLYDDFISDKNTDKTPIYWHLLDYLLSELGKDINLYSETEIKELSIRLNADVPLSVAEIYSSFIRTANINGKPLSNWIYNFDARGNSELNLDAYGLDDFTMLAYCVFNSAVWAELELVQKALSNKIYAELWLSTALHFLCALRKTDMKRLPAPALPDNTDIIRVQIESGSFPDAKAKALTDEMVMRVNMMSLTPSKTAVHSFVPEIKFFVPESLKTALGTIIAIVLLHHPEVKPGDIFIVPRKEIRYMRAFFGLRFAEALGNRNLDTRRANKAYLQGIDVTADAQGSSSKPKGYMLAALARSHKGGIGSLPEITDIYLKDANFTGYKSEFIAREMFERGIFSFIPAILLEIYEGHKYKSLSVDTQTKLIKTLGLSAQSIEYLAHVTESALAKSRRVIAELFSETISINSKVFKVLQNVAAGNAPGKQDGCLCLMTAAGYRCPHSERNSCIGCGYEIFTKSVMHSLMQEYVRISELRKKSGDVDSQRYRNILEQAILPAIAEIISSARMLYSETEVNLLLDIVEKGIDYVNYET